MEKYLSIIKLGFKYLIRYRRRYYFLFAALIFGFAVVTFISSTKDGMNDSAYYTAQSHYAGDIVVDARNYLADGGWLNHMEANEISEILKAAEESKINIKHTVFRTLRMSNIFTHHIGNSVKLRYIIGCDWENEKHILEKMDFESVPDYDIGDDGIILSSHLAKQLEAKEGDSIILELDTRYRQKNTGVFIVKGIVHDNSIYGYYKAYISRVTLNRLLLYNDDDCSLVGFFLENPSKAEKQRKILYNFISPRLQTGELVYNKDDMNRERATRRNGIAVFLYTLPVYLSEISDIMDAMNILTVLLYTMMLLTIFSSAGVTYSLILNERSKEMGIMRTFGFYNSDLHLVLWTEISIISIISIIIGFLLSGFISWIVSFVSFSWFPGFELFLKNEKLIPMYLPLTILSNIIMLLFVIIVLVLYQSGKVAGKNLPGLLSGEPL